MLKNYLTIAFRTLWYNRVFTFLNISGLSLGMACILLIGLWVKDEMSFNRFHTHTKDTYRVMANIRWGDLQTLNTTPGPLAEALRKEVPEIKQAIKMTAEWDTEAIFIVNDKKDKETGGFASEAFFELLSFPLIEGNPATVLKEPNSIVISQMIAKKYFGESSPIGKTIRLYVGTDLDFIVSGVMQPIPRNSSWQFNFVIPFQYLENMADYAKTWGNYSFETYVLLHPKAAPQRVEAKMNQVLGKYRPDTKDELFLQPLADMYVYNKFENGKVAGGRIEYVRLFSLAAVAVLLITCINFMNLATARSARRSKEVGIRKVVGAGRYSLIAQFICESIILSLVAIIFSVLLVEIVLPSFNTLTGKELAFHYQEPSFFLSMIGIAIFTGIIAGSYPALYLSGLLPAKVLKGQFAFSYSSVLFRKGLVVFQFVLSISLIISTVVVYRQINYVKEKNLGLDRENIIYLTLEQELRKHLNVVKHELESLPGIQVVTTASQNPLSVDGTSADLDWAGKNPNESVSIAGLRVGYDFLRTMNIPLKEGRDFSPEFRADPSNYIINEAAAKMMRLSEPIGQEVSFWRGKGKIVGVVKDFHMASLHEAIKPLIIALYPEGTSMILVKTKPGQTQQAIASLEKVTRKYNPQYPFEYHFLDESFERQYKSEMLVGELAAYAASLAIFISCLGLFGLAAFTAEQRTKEIGIRKVLGASVVNITMLLSTDFLKLVSIAIVVASPLALWLMHTWLEDFAYRIDINLGVFMMAGILALLITLLTVSFQSIKAALANPVKSLRSE